MSAWLDFLKSTISPPTPGTTPSRRTARVPFRFTSDYNLSTIGQSPAGLTPFTNNLTQQTTTSTPNTDISVLAQNQAFRTPGTIAMAINPQSIHWTQAKRFTKRDTMDGSTYMHFLNSKQQNNDVPRIEFTGMTGNISLKGSALPYKPIPDDTRGAEKLLIFHSLWNLTRQPMLYQVSNTGNWLPNKFYISYESQVLPFSILLIGFYDAVFDWTERSEKVNQAEYKFSFIVQDSRPDIDDLATTIGNALLPPNIENL